MNIQWVKQPLKCLAIVTLIAAFFVHFSTDYAIGGASPLALLIMALGAFLLHNKSELVADLLLVVAGATLFAFPFLNEAPTLYSFLSLPIFGLGIKNTIAWWNREG